MTVRRRFWIGTYFLTIVSLVFGAQVPLSAAESSDGDWPRYQTPEEAGFSSERLAAAEDYWNSLDDAPVSAFFVVFKGKVLAQSGDSTYGFWCHSVRKSFLSALYGIHVDKGNIDLEKTMEELEIDDVPPLTEAEKQAKVIHLLKARSGVYHPAACEAQSMRDARPARGSHPPDTFWYYNNWDFNALGTIFRQETGRDIFEEFGRKIARRVGMQDFEASECEYAFEHQYSIHPCYTFRMSVRDRARFGQLFLQKGRWGDRQIVPEAWVEESTRAHSQGDDPGEGYGYMWWTFSREFFRQNVADPRLHHLWGFTASGYGGQWIFVLPDAEMVIVTGVDVPAGGFLLGEEVGPFFEQILTAREIVDLGIKRVKVKPRSVAAGDTLRLVAKTKNSGETRSLPTEVSFYLSPRGRVGEEARRIGGVELRRVAAGRKKTVRLNVPVPSDLAPGDYVLVASVDEEKANYDLRRDNNILVKKKRIEIR
jgi:CubicO group peptidase (beta-lactamase class C family)